MQVIQRLYTFDYTWYGDTFKIQIYEQAGNGPSKHPAQDLEKAKCMKCSKITSLKIFYYHPVPKTIPRGTLETRR